MLNTKYTKIDCCCRSSVTFQSVIFLLLIAMAGTASAQRISASGGNYTINASGTNTGTNFTSFTNAINDLNTVGTLSGNVVFSVSAGQTFSERPPVITATGNSSAAISFIRSGAGANPVITAPGNSLSDDDAAITIRGGDYFTFNGIDVTAADSSLEYGYLLRRAGRDNAARNNTVTNAIILMHQLKGNTYAVLQTNDSIVGIAPVIYGVPVFTETNSNNSYTNLTIGRSFNGIWLKGFENTSSPDSNNIINNNTIGRTGVNHDIGADGISVNVYGMQVSWQYNTQTNSNTIQNLTLRNLSSGFATISAAFFSGCTLGTFNNNTIARIATTKVVGYNNNMAVYGLNANTMTSYAINGNTLSAFSSDSYNGIFSSTNTNVRVMNNTISGFTGIQGSNGIYLTTSTGCRVSGNSISDIAITVATGPSVFVYYVTGGNTDTIDNNIAQNINTMGQFYGLTTTGSNNFRIYNNTFRNITTGNNTTVMTCAGLSANARLYNNTINNVMSIGSSIVYGLQTTLVNNTTYIYNNQISNIGSNTTGTAAVYGWHVTNATSGTVVCNFYNNSISNLRKVFTGASTATRLLFGMHLASTANANASYNVYFNSVSIDGSGLNASSTVINNAATASATAPVVNLRNNIFANTSGAQTGVAKHYLIYAGGTSFGNASSSSNYNNWYLPNSTNGFFGFSSSDRATLAVWKTITAFTSYDANSITSDPLFNGPDNLLLMPGSPANQAGTFITTYTNDITGAVRHATTPSMGAFETPKDVTKPEIAYAIIPHNFNTMNYALNDLAAITDPANGSINVQPGTLPRIYYKLKQHANAFAGNTSATSGWKYTEAINNTSPFSFIVDYSLLSGGAVNTGDTIQYFIVAQDTAGIANVQSNPAEGFAGSSVASVTLAPANPNFFTIFNNPASYSATDVIQATTKKVGQGTENNVILRIKVTTAATGTSAYVSQFVFNTAGGGNDSMNIKGARVFYTGSSTDFNTNNLFGSVNFSPASATIGSFTVNGSSLTANGDNYFWLVYNMNSAAVIYDSVDAELTSLTYFSVVHPYFSGATPGARTIRAEYCASAPSSATNEDIATFTLVQNGNTILSNGVACLPTLNNPAANKQYSDFTGLPATQVLQNATVNFSACLNTSTNSLIGSYIAVYIDYNQNGLWDTDEMAYTSAYANRNDTTFTGSFVIPCKAPTGETRMRIVLRYNTALTASDACIFNLMSSYAYGETEDYMINITANPVAYLWSTAVQQTGVAGSGIADHAILRMPLKVNGCGKGTITDFYFRNTGTTSAGDVVAAKLYSTGTSKIFNTNKLLGIVYGPGASFAFNGISDTLLSEAADTNNYWLAYDVAAAAVSGNTIDATIDSIGLLGIHVIPSVTSPAGNRTIQSAMLYNSMEVTQTNTSKVSVGAVNAQILGLQVVTSSTGAPIPLTAIELATTGTTSLSDIRNLRIWYTGNSKVFSTGVSFGNTVTNPAATQSITGYQPLANDTNYFWVTYDVPAAATLNNLIDAEINSISVSGIPHMVFSPTPAGSRQIIKAYCPSVPVFNTLPIFTTQYEDIGNVALIQEGQTLLSHGVGCTPVINNVNANGTYTDYTLTAPVANVKQNIPVQFNICAISSFDMLGSNVSVFIDFNQNGNWDTEDLVYVSPGITSNTASVFTGSFVIPCSAATGNTRMRVIISPTPGQACSGGMYYFGETEDYVINIIPNPAQYISSAAIQNSNNVAPGVTDAPILRIPVVASGCGIPLANNFVFSTTGTTSTGDIVSAKLYSTGNSTVFSTAKLLGTVGNPTGRFDFAITPDTLRTVPGDTNNYWLAYQVSASAILGNVLDATFDSAELINAYRKPVVSNPAGSRTIQVPMTYSSSTSAQPVLNRVETGSSNNAILRLSVVTSSTGSSIDLNSIDVATTGTTSLSNITNLKIWYTGTSPVFDTLVQFGTTVSTAAAVQTVSQLRPLANGTNYFWITYSIATNSTSGNAVDAEVTSITVDGAIYTPSVTAPAGVRLIRPPYCAAYPSDDAATGEDIGQFTLKHRGATILSNGSCTPAFNNPNANKRYSDFTASIPATSMQRNTTIDFSLCAIKASTGSFDCRVAVFIDYNHNGVWDADEMAYSSGLLSTNNNNPNFSGSFVIPCDAVTGETRMRVMLVSFITPALSTACIAGTGLYNYGETEDYIINIEASPVSYVSSTALQITDNVAPGETNAPVLRIPVKADGCGAIAASAFYFNTAGTTTASNIVAAKLYTTGTSPVFNTTKLIGTVLNPSGSFSFSGLTDTLASGAADTANYWLAYELSASAGLGNSIDARFDSLIIVPGASHIPSVTTPAGSRTVVIPMSYTSSTVTQLNLAKVEAGSVHSNIIGLQVVTSATGSAIPLTAIDLSTAGTTSLINISNLKIFYTGNTNLFATATQFGTTVSAPAAVQTISGSQLLANGTNYFWITYDIVNGAVTGDVVDAEISSVTVAGIQRSPSVASPAGNREIVTAYCSSAATSAVNDDIGNVTISDGTTTLLNNGNASSPNNNVTANRQYTSFVETLAAFQVMKGRSYQVSTTSIFSSTPYNSTRSVYIDFNNDGDFTDAGELAWTSGTTLSSATLTGNFIVPLNAVSGTTRMRVVLIAGSSPLSSSSPCATYTFGETEDYAISIVPALPPVVYSWNVSAASGAFGTAANWSPSRTQLSLNDILVVNNGGTKTITGIPVQQIRSLYVSNNTTLNISGTSALTIADTLQIDAGSRINTGAMTLVLGTDTNNIGVLTGTGNYSGTFKRWINAASASYSFPMFVGSNNKAVSVSYQVSPLVAGALSVSFTPGNPGAAGLPLTDASLLHNIVNVSQEGVWNILPAEGLTGGTFDVGIYSDHTPGVNDAIQTSLIYREGTIDQWTIPGSGSYTIGNSASMYLQRSSLSGYGQFTIGGTSTNPLPVKLLSFSGWKNANDAVLAWTTASETNNKGFEVQRSFNGTEFSTIDFVNGTNSSKGGSYRYNDRNVFVQPISTVYYRLKQVDFNNGYEYAEIISVSTEAFAGSVSVYPNPFNQNLTLNIDAQSDEALSISIVDLAGRTVFEHAAELNQGNNQLTLNKLEVLRSGVYFLNINTANGRKVMKLVKQ